MLGRAGLALALTLTFSPPAFAPPPGNPGVVGNDEERSFLNAIFSVPGDDVARLVYADWLEDQGQAERAEYLRVELERARIEDRYGSSLGIFGSAPREVKARYRQLLARSQELAERGANAPAREDDTHYARLVERRGWIDEVTLDVPANAFSAFTTGVLERYAQRYPLRKVTLRFPSPWWLDETRHGQRVFGRTVGGYNVSLPSNSRVEWLDLDNVSFARFADYFTYEYGAENKPSRLTARINGASMRPARSFRRQTFTFDHEYEPRARYFLSRWLFGAPPGNPYGIRRELPPWEPDGNLSFDDYWRWVAAQDIEGLTVLQPASRAVDLRFDHEKLRGTKPVPSSPCGPTLEAMGMTEGD